MTARHVSVIGAGLAGCAAALAAETCGAQVTLFEQRPAVIPPTHQTPLPGELTGTADLGVEDTDRATGLLKAELRLTCPAVMECADAARIGERTAAVDRDNFAEALTAHLQAAAAIDLRREELRSLPDGPVVIASGPGTWSPLAREIHRAAAAGFRFSFIGRPPLIDAESLDLSEARWEPPYPGAEPALFLPLTAREAENLADRLASCARNEPPGFEEETLLAEESRSAERLAADPDDRLQQVLRGPRGPEGTIEAPALCLTPDDEQRSAYHVEGLATSLAPEDQQAALSTVGALSEVRLVRAGMIQRTPWLAGHEAILASLQLRRTGRALLAGSLTGVFGYCEAMALGAVAGIGAARINEGAEPLAPPPESLTGALCLAVAKHDAHPDGRMLAANFGMIPAHPRDDGFSKSERRERQVGRALEATERYLGAG